MYDTHNFELRQTSITQTSQLVNIPFLHIHAFGSAGKHNHILDDGLLDILSKGIRFHLKETRIYFLGISSSGPFFSVFPPGHFIPHHDVADVCSTDDT